MGLDTFAVEGEGEEMAFISGITKFKKLERLAPAVQSPVTYKVTMNEPASKNGKKNMALRRKNLTN